MAGEPASRDDRRWAWADRETLLDILVNVVPLVMLLFFSVYFTVIQPWGFELSWFGLMHFLTLFPFLVLVLVTYVSAKVISRDERRT